MLGRPIDAEAIKQAEIKYGDLVKEAKHCQNAFCITFSEALEVVKYQSKANERLNNGG